MPWMRVRCSFSMALRAFFSLREWMTAEEPAGRLESPASISESELSSSAPSSTETFLVGSSSGSSSTLGLAIFRDCLLLLRVRGGLVSSVKSLVELLGSIERWRQERSFFHNFQPGRTPHNAESRWADGNFQMLILGRRLVLRLPKLHDM